MTQSSNDIGYPNLLDLATSDHQEPWIPLPQGPNCAYVLFCLNLTRPVSDFTKMPVSNVSYQEWKSFSCF